MTDFKAAKVVSALPVPLEPDTVYFIRAGEGFDIKVTNGAGAIIAYDLNQLVATLFGQLLLNAPSADAARIVLELGSSATKAASYTPDAGTVPLRTESGRIRTEAGSGTKDAVNLGQMNTALEDKVSSDDTRLSNSREWIAETMPQAEAEAGTASTRRAVTAQRLRQAALAMWDAVSSGWGRNFVQSSNASAARSQLELGSASTRDATTSSVDVTSGRVMTVGQSSFGSAALTQNYISKLSTGRQGFYGYSGTGVQTTDGSGYITPGAHIVGLRGAGADSNSAGWSFGRQISENLDDWYGFYVALRPNDAENPVLVGRRTLFLTDRNIQATTGQSTTLPMTQKATTDAINARGFPDASGILTASSGTLSNDMSAFLSLKTKAEIIAWLAAP